MVGLKKSKLTGKPKEKQYVYDEFSFQEKGQKDCLTVRLACQCGIEKAALFANGIGTVPYATNRGQIPCEVFGQVRRVFFATVSSEDNVRASSLIGVVTDEDGGTVYLQSAKTAKLEKKWSFLPSVQTATFHDRARKELLVMVDSEQAVYFNSTWVQGELGVTDATGPLCVCKDRLFLAARNRRVHFGAPGEVEFSAGNAECGTLFFPSAKGEILNLVSDGEYVYVVFSHGLARIKAAGLAKDFVVETLSFDGEEILQGSAGFCGGKLFFLAMDGVYILSGTVAKRLELSLPILPKAGGQVCGEGVCGPFYIVQYVDKEDELVALAVHESGTRAEFVYSVDGLTYQGGQTLCVSNGKICVLSETADGRDCGTAFANFADLTFGDLKRKAITGVRALGEGVVRIWLYSGMQAVSGTLDMQSGVAEWKTCLRGERFFLNVELEQGARIRELVFTVAKGD